MTSCSALSPTGTRSRAQGGSETLTVRTPPSPPLLVPEPVQEPDPSSSPQPLITGAHPPEPLRQRVCSSLSEDGFPRHHSPRSRPLQETRTISPTMQPEAFESRPRQPPPTGQSQPPPQPPPARSMRTLPPSATRQPSPTTSPSARPSPSSTAVTVATAAVADGGPPCDGGATLHS